LFLPENLLFKTRRFGNRILLSSSDEIYLAPIDATRADGYCKLVFAPLIFDPGYITVNVVPTSLIPFTLMKIVIRFTETSVLKRATSCHISEYGILRSHGRENLIYYIALTGWTL
jgi:hypothetical protein